MNQASAEQNEQNIVRVEGDGQVVVFKQIAGLLARRIVFRPGVGDRLERGQRVGLIKFGSRVDVLFDACRYFAGEGWRPGSGRGQRFGVLAAERRTGRCGAIFRQPRSALMDIPTPRPGQDGRRPRPMRKGMYILPSLFTTGNIAAGFYAILEVAACQRCVLLAFG